MSGISGEALLCQFDRSPGDAPQLEDLIDEDTPVIAGRKHSVYSQSKTAAEKLIRKYIGYGLNAVIVCPSVILGQVCGIAVVHDCFLPLLKEFLFIRGV
ncbi:MAG: SDR family oxidoreductase [Odoribacter splanchnicus]